MNTRLVIYAWFCDFCGSSHAKKSDLDYDDALDCPKCPKCGSTDITKAETYSRIQYDDAECEERLAQIRGEISLPNYSKRFLRIKQAG